jgi:hypothetical protein
MLGLKYPSVCISYYLENDKALENLRVERPLRNKTSSNVRSELSSGDNVRRASGVETNGVKDDRRVVLTNVRAIVCLETGVTHRREIFLVSLPFQALYKQTVRYLQDKRDITAEFIPCSPKGQRWC